jgi:DNA-binding NtrC family response regulator
VAVALFGMVQGDESDTDTASLGVIEKAHGGTLVIENIGALSRALQTELLVYLQTLKFKRIGGTRRHLADTRLIVTNREPLDTGGADGRFDSALLKVIQKLTVAVPALRHRLEDVVDLARRLAKHFAPQADRRQPEFAPAVTHALATYRWPGNLHELRCVIERALLLAEGDTLQANHLPSDLLIQVKHAREATIAEDLDEVQIAAHA